MGHEAVGRIAAVGEGVDPRRIGERVVLRPLLACGSCEPCLERRPNICRNARLVGRDLAGAFADRLVVPERAAVPLPEHVPAELATLTEPLANAVHVTGRSVRDGDDVLVIGAGPIGVLVARMALDRGARRVFATDPIPARLERARAQGALPLEGEDVAEALAAATEGRGVDVVVDAVGLSATWELSLRAVRPGGGIEVLGLGSPTATIDAYALIGKEVRITGSFAWTEEDFDRALVLVAAGAIDASDWFTTLSLAEGQRAFEELVDTTERFKVVLAP
jgi:2-desacetyl-2-hydroxyethyl bacteriochlorophyllide A dehydrogenase